MIAAATLNLAARLHDQLLAPRGVQSGGQLDAFVVNGGMKVDGGTARCMITIDPDWMIRPPKVICCEPWVRRHIDWHAFSDGSLCYVFPAEWRDILGHLAEDKSPFAALDSARLWMLRNVPWLLSKHLLADQLGLTDWPVEWQAWPHDPNKAKREYDRGK